MSKTDQDRLSDAAGDGSQTAVPETPGRTGRIVVAQGLDALSHGNFQKTTQLSERGKAVLPLPCGIGLILNDKGGIVGSGAPPQESEAVPCAQSIARDHSELLQAVSDFGRIHTQQTTIITELSERVASLEEYKERVVQQMRIELGETVEQHINRSGTAIRNEVSLEVESIFQRCDKQLENKLHAHREVCHTPDIFQGKRTGVGNLDNGG